jgi:hypothetical protein
LGEVEGTSIVAIVTLIISLTKHLPASQRLMLCRRRCDDWNS